MPSMYRIPSSLSHPHSLSPPFPSPSPYHPFSHLTRSPSNITTLSTAPNSSSPPPLSTCPLITLPLDEIASDKSQQMAKLLDFQANPTRKALLEDLVAKGVLNDVQPEILALYTLLETKFNPLG